MRIALTAAPAVVILCASALLVSCDLADEGVEKEQQAFSNLSSFLSETEMTFFYQRFTNTNDFLDRIRSDLSSPDRHGKISYTVCDALWVNSVVGDWLASVGVTNHHQQASTTALIAEYHLENEKRFIGIGFDARRVAQNGPPVAGCTRIELPAELKRARR